MTGPRGAGPGPDPARDDPRAPGQAATRRRNADADGDRWPVSACLAENHRGMHASDAAVIRHHCAFHRRLPAGLTTPTRTRDAPGPRPARGCGALQPSNSV